MIAKKTAANKAFGQGVWISNAQLLLLDRVKELLRKKTGMSHSRATIVGHLASEFLAAQKKGAK
jgi:hypothetical protein